MVADLRLQHSINLPGQITAETEKGAGGTHRSYKVHSYYGSDGKEYFGFTFKRSVRVS